MRRKIQIPRILKINWIKGLSVGVVFNNGESRVIDFKDVLNQVRVSEDSPAYKLNNPEEFAKMELEGYTLSWRNVSETITGLDGSPKEVPYEIGPDILFELSKPEKPDSNQQLGRLIKACRRKSGLTQQELANRSGTTRTYISRIENNHSDIELGTLRKIIEVGLGKQLQIQIS